MGDWRIIGSGIFLDVVGIIALYLAWAGFPDLQTTGLFALVLGIFVTVVGIFTTMKTGE